MGGMSQADPSRGDVWFVDLEPARGHERGGRRPAVIVSVDLFNRGPSGLVVVVPATSRERGVPFEVRVEPPEGGLSRVSFVRCEDVRSVSTDRLGRRLGSVAPETLAQIEDRLRILLDL